MLEPRGLYRTDGKRTDRVTMISWEMGKRQGERAYTVFDPILGGGSTEKILNAFRRYSYF